jgi:hypothetical protein
MTSVATFLDLAHDDPQRPDPVRATCGALGAFAFWTSLRGLGWKTPIFFWQGGTQNSKRIGGKR